MQDCSLPSNNFCCPAPPAPCPHVLAWYPHPADLMFLRSKVPKKVTTCAFTVDGRHMLAADKFGDVLAAATQRPEGECRTCCSPPAAELLAQPSGYAATNLHTTCWLALAPRRISLPATLLQACQRARRRSPRSCWATTAPSSPRSRSRQTADCWPPPTGRVKRGLQLPPSCVKREALTARGTRLHSRESGLPSFDPCTQLAPPAGTSACV